MTDSDKKTSVPQTPTTAPGGTASAEDHQLAERGAALA